jgi:hypothetical protein
LGAEISDPPQLPVETAPATTTTTVQAVLAEQPAFLPLSEVLAAESGQIDEEMRASDDGEYDGFVLTAEAWQAVQAQLAYLHSRSGIQGMPTSTPTSPRSGASQATKRQRSDPAQPRTAAAAIVDAMSVNELRLLERQLNTHFNQDPALARAEIMASEAAWLAVLRLHGLTSAPPGFPTPRHTGE